MFKTDDRVYETSTTTGTGDYTLDGAVVGFTTFAGMGANNLCPYFATDDTNWEVGIGTILTGPARLQRTTVLRSSNADAAVNWAAGTRKIRCGLPAKMAIPRALSKSVAGAADVALTQDEQRRDQLVLTGVLTGNINVTVDATPWRWSVYNNTTGDFTLKLKTTAGAGVFVPRGGRMVLECDGVDVVDVAPAPVYDRVVRTAGDITTTSTSLVDITGATSSLITGARPVHFSMCGTVQGSVAGNGGQVVLNIAVDGALQFGTEGILTEDARAGGDLFLNVSGDTAVLTAAGHTIKGQWFVQSGTGTIKAGAARSFLWSTHEIR